MRRRGLVRLGSTLPSENPEAQGIFSAILGPVYPPADLYFRREYPFSLTSIKLQGSEIFLRVLNFLIMYICFCKRGLKKSPCIWIDKT